MVRVAELYFVNKDVRAFQKRLDFLDKKITEREAQNLNYGGLGYDRAEREALKRLLSQVSDKGQPCDPPSKTTPDPDLPHFGRLRRAGWQVKYLGGSHAKPWQAGKDEHGKTTLLDAATFEELEELVRISDALPTTGLW